MIGEQTAAIDVKVRRHLKHFDQLPWIERNRILTEYRNSRPPSANNANDHIFLGIMSRSPYISHETKRSLNKITLRRTVDLLRPPKS